MVVKLYALHEMLSYISSAPQNAAKIMCGSLRTDGLVVSHSSADIRYTMNDGSKTTITLVIRDDEP